MDRVSAATASRVPGVGSGERPFSVRRSPMVIKTADDLRRLTSSPQTVRRLPPNGVVVAIPGIDETTQNAFRLQIKRYARACGCGAGGATFLLASTALGIYLVVLAQDRAWSAVIRAIGVGVILVPSLTLVVKLLSLSFARIRFCRSCAHMLRLLRADAD